MVEGVSERVDAPLDRTRLCAGCSTVVICCCRFGGGHVNAARPYRRWAIQLVLRRRSTARPASAAQVLRLPTTLADARSRDAPHPKRARMSILVGLPPTILC